MIKGYVLLTTQTHLSQTLTIYIPMYFTTFPPLLHNSFAENFM